MVLILLLPSTNVFFNYLHNTYVESEKGCATFQAASDACISRLRVHARNIKMLNLSMFHHSNFGELLVC